ncbi:MAG: SMP-30/gluconolactonase/LRE family protein [Polaromonas sp.]|uniref:SMP-30/gluconolactonase/LRE family protein n=1 Tax=Polaromonas sp. TaxID=1869339 RepID=UPI0025E5D299|nr:SMP-30/gluconolactonase/LRE family protein [Polaromonas sp.]MBI2727782.1 SMP-30/gluconolactonase/LRE family protein [Polaromonas sp.]
MTWQTVVTQPSALGESPFWHPDEQMLYWVDIPGRQVHRLNVFMGSIESWAMPSEPGSIAPVKDAAGGSDGLVIALRDGIYRARHWGAELQLIAPALHDPASSRFNDGKADPAGRFWVGTIYEPRNAAKAQLYSLDARTPMPGQMYGLRVMAGGATTANGLAWSPDAKTIYWSDTPSHTIRAWDWDIDANTMGGERIFKRWPAKPAGWQSGMPGYDGRPDGAAVDVQGNYYVAMFEGARVLKLSPQGEVLTDIPVPTQCPTMPCFGGADLHTLYLTSARQNRPDAELQTYPDSGCVFSMQVDVPGMPVNFFID